MQRKVLLYDKSGEEHYNLISALHKSVRSSDVDAALYWLARMLEAGEDRLYIARRLVRMAIEDIGLADPRALEQAIAAMQAVHFLGIPEGDLALAQAAIYLAVAPKSDAAYRALGAVHGGRARRPSPSRCRCICATPPTQRHEGVGLRRGLPARAQVRGRRDRTWSACRRRWPDAGGTIRPTAAWRSASASAWKSCVRRARRSDSLRPYRSRDRDGLPRQSTGLSRHSSRSAVVGSSPAARRAGSHEATAAMAKNSTAMAQKVRDRSASRPPACWS